MQIEPLNTKEKVPSPRVTTHDKFVTTHDKSGRQKNLKSHVFMTRGQWWRWSWNLLSLEKIGRHHSWQISHHSWKADCLIEILRLEIFYLCSKNFSDGWKLLVNTCNEEFHHPFPNLIFRFWRKIRSSIFVQSSLMISLSPLMKSTRYEKFNNLTFAYLTCALLNILNINT